MSTPGNNAEENRPGNTLGHHDLSVTPPPPILTFDTEYQR